MLHIVFEFVLTCRFTLSLSLLFVLLSDVFYSYPGSGPCFTVACILLSSPHLLDPSFIFFLGLVVCLSFRVGRRSVVEGDILEVEKWVRASGPCILRALSPLPFGFGVLFF